MKTKFVKIAKTKNGIPALWESLKVSEDGLIRATLITRTDASIKNALYVKTYDQKQGLVPIRVNDFLIKAYQEKDGTIGISILKVLNIKIEEITVKLGLVARCEAGQDTWEIDEDFKDQIEKFKNVVLTIKEKLKLENHNKVYSPLSKRNESWVEIPKVEITELAVIHEGRQRK